MQDSPRHPSNTLLQRPAKKMDSRVKPDSARTMKTKIAVRDKEPHRFQVVPLRDARPSTTTSHSNPQTILKDSTPLLNVRKQLKPTISTANAPKIPPLRPLQQPVFPSIVTSAISHPHVQNKVSMAPIKVRASIKCAEIPLKSQTRLPKFTTSKSASAIPPATRLRTRTTTGPGPPALETPNHFATPENRQTNRLHYRSPSVGSVPLLKSSSTMHSKSSSPQVSHIVDPDATLVGTRPSRHKEFKHSNSQSLSFPMQKANPCRVEPCNRRTLNAHSRIKSMGAYNPAKRHAMYLDELSDDEVSVSLSHPSAIATDGTVLGRRGALKRASAALIESCSTTAIYGDDRNETSFVFDSFDVTLCDNVVNISSGSEDVATGPTDDLLKPFSQAIHVTHPPASTPLSLAISPSQSLPTLLSLDHDHALQTPSKRSRRVSSPAGTGNAKKHRRQSLFFSADLFSSRIDSPLTSTSLPSLYSQESLIAPRLASSLQIPLMPMLSEAVKPVVKEFEVLDCPPLVLEMLADLDMAIMEWEIMGVEIGSIVAADV